MAPAPLNIPIAGDMKDYVEARVESGAFATPADYINELILRDHLRTKLEENLIAAMQGPFVEITDEEWEHGDIMAIAEERLAQIKHS